MTDDVRVPRLLRPVILIGMPGAGKSTLGHSLAARLNVPFYDLDTAIETELNMSVSECFAARGEEGFRAAESRTLARLLDGTPLVLASGGGTPLREENRKRMRAGGYVIYLQASLRQLTDRLQGDTQRPLLRGGDLKTRLRTLFEAREEAYRRTAHETVDLRRYRGGALLKYILQRLRNTDNLMTGDHADDE